MKGDLQLSVLRKIITSDSSASSSSENQSETRSQEPITLKTISELVGTSEQNAGTFYYQ
jgi:hypothetical protein